MKKRKIVSIMALSLVVAMGAVSLTGCGSQAKATDITIDDGDTIIVDEEDLDVETDTEAESESDVDEITSTEVIGDDETATDFVGAEDENIVLYAEIEKYPSYQPLSDEEYTPVNEIVTANEDIVICNGDGFKVGYIKNGATISVTEYSSIAWARFENPIKGTDYDYLYVLKDYIAVPDANQFTVTESDIKQKIIDDIKNLDVTDYIFVDTPSNDMEVFEFRIESVFKDEIDFNYWYSQCTEDGNIALSSYMTYCIECEKDTDGWISCKVYYKDEIPEEVWNQYYYKY